MIIYLLSLAHVYAQTSYQISLSSYVISSPSTYTISLSLTSSFPTSGLIELAFPSYFSSFPLPSCSMQSPSSSCSCSFSGSSLYLSISLSASLPSLSSIVFTITNLSNPSPAITMTFLCNTRNSDLSLITSYSTSLTYSPLPLQYVDIASLTGISGAVDTWNITTSLDLEVPAGGTLTILFPKWNVNLNPTSFQSFITSAPICDKTCSMSGDLLTVVLSSAATGPWFLTISNARNPPNTQPVTGFVVNTFSSQGLMQSSSSGSVTSLYGGPLDFGILSNSLDKVNTKAVYTASFTTSNPVPATSSILISFPASVTLALATITPTFGFDYSTIGYTSTSATISISPVVASYKAEGWYFEFSIDSCINPSDTATAFITITVMSQGFVSDTSSLFSITASPGEIIVTSILPSNSQVNLASVYTFVFYSLEPVKAGNCLVIIFPVEVSESTQNACSSIAAGISSASVCSASGNVLRVTNAFPTDYGTGTIQFSMAGVTNPMTTRPTSAFSITLFSDSTFLYSVSQNSTYTISASPGVLTGSVAASSYVTGSTSTYTVTLTINDPIPAGGYVELYLPAELAYTGTSCSTVSGFSSGAVCTVGTSSFNITNGFTAQFTGSLQIQINNLLNPPSTKPTSSFIIHTCSGGYYIDWLSSGLTIVMSSLHSLSSATISVGSSIVGINTYYTFSITPFNAIPSGGYVLIQPPSSMLLTTAITCTGTGLASFSCAVISGGLKVSLFPSTSTVSSSFQITAGTIQNPLSTKPVAFTFLTSDGVYSIDFSSITFQVQLPSTFSSISISPTSPYIGVSANYTISYTVSNSIPSGGYLTITLGFLTSSVSCSLNSLPISCLYSSSILALESSFPTTGVILLESITNPSTTGPYSLTLTSKTSDGYSIDSSLLSLLIQCQSPCSTCSSTADTCLSCLTSSTQPYFWGNKCNPNCDTGYYSTSDYSCLPCDSQCLSCSLAPTNCTSCATSYLYQSTCVAACPSSTFLNAGKCTDCTVPCKSCTSALQCLSCTSPYNFYSNACVLTCPADTTVAVNGVCQACVSCSACETTPSTCTSCNPPDFLYNQACYSQCPSSTFSKSNFCEDCSSNCQSCTGSANYCTACELGWNLYGSTCVAICSSGYYYSNSTCLACNSTCATCSASACLSCASSYLLQAGECVQECSPGFYAHGLVCSACAEGCSACAGISQCLSCEQGLYFNNGSCLDSCLAGTFEYQGVCASCSDCPVCDSAQGCLYCTQGLFFNNSCVAQCPSGYVGVLNTCVECSNCTECSVQPYNCTQCEADLLLFESTCLESCPEGYAAINSACVLNTTGLCAPGCTLSLLDNQQCDGLCNTTKCNYDNSYCSGVQTLNYTYASSLDIKENPLVMSGIGMVGLGLSALLSLTGPAAFIAVAMPVTGALERVSWLSLLVAVGRADNFRGRVLEESDGNRMGLIRGVLFAIWTVQFMINVGFCFVYWRYVRKNDGLHRAWGLKHRWGVAMIMCSMGVLSYRTVALMISNVPGVQAFQGKFEKLENLKKPLKTTEVISLVFTTIPLLAVSGYILYVFSTGSFVYVMALDAICITSLSVLISLWFLVSPIDKIKKNSYKIDEDNNITVEITEISHSKAVPELNQERIRSEVESEEPTDRDAPSSEESAKLPHSAKAVKVRINKKPIKKSNYSFGLQNLVPATVDEDLIDLDNFAIDPSDPRKLLVSLRNSNQKITIFKDFTPVTILNEDGQSIDMDLNLNEYDLISINIENPRIGEFQHKLYKTNIRLLRDFNGASIVETEEDIDEFDKASVETLRIVQTGERPMFDCDFSEIVGASDSFMSMKNRSEFGSGKMLMRTGLGSSKVLMRSGSPPKLSATKILRPHPGLEDISQDSERSNK